jgi:hypothetical protein
LFPETSGNVRRSARYFDVQTAGGQPGSFMMLLRIVIIRFNHVYSAHMRCTAGGTLAGEPPSVDNKDLQQEPVDRLWNA